MDQAIISENICVKVKMFAVFQEVLATDEMQITLHAGAPVSQIFDLLFIQNTNI